MIYNIVRNTIHTRKGGTFVARKKNQKIKTLRVLDILKAHNGESNAITTKQLGLVLQEEGIPCDRRTLIDDIETLSVYIKDNPEYSFRIRTISTSKGNAYYTVPKPSAASNEFSDKELRCLINGINNLRLTEEINKSDAVRMKEKLVQLAPAGYGSRKDSD